MAAARWPLSGLLLGFFLSHIKWVISVWKYYEDLATTIQGCIPTLTKLSQLREAAEVPDADYGPFGPSIHHYLFSSSCQAPATHANVAQLTQGILKDADF